MPKITGLVKKGSDLTSANDGLQPSFKLTDDGYGLQTLSVVWIQDRDSTKEFARDDSFPIDGFTDFKLHKWSVSYDGLDLRKVVCDYVSINTLVNLGEHTNCQVSASNGLSSEPLTAHPNFYELAVGYINVIAGAPDYTESELGPTVTDANGRKGKSYIGQNGACFERKTGGRFIGFVDPSVKTLYGKTSYLSPTTQFAGIMYFRNDSEYVQKFRQMLGTSSMGRNWIGQLPDLIPSYVGDSFTAANGNYQLLMSQVNFEDFGTLVKVSYEIRFSAEGWDPMVYKTATSPS
jgi:hypothetical protein